MSDCREEVEGKWFTERFYRKAFSSTALMVSRCTPSVVAPGLSRTMTRSRCVPSAVLFPAHSPAALPRLSARLPPPSSPFSHSDSFPVRSLMVRWSVRIWSFCCRTVCRSSSAVVRRKPQSSPAYSDGSSACC
ncbi:hypothetical protein EYF80_042983 [Liparis tanakae]|uniref:Uncharacterized protein n=1 Tax=Liparis tanakae TaxID=230148 RepID=A0A4Z2G1Q0_9TELE|nr:hypothetical protein EYF80_042983 [Liparis tanakae]